MGTVFSKTDFSPVALDKIGFDPPSGFKKREMLATEEEMISAKIPKEDRDYCAHTLLKYRACRADVFPFLYKCHHERHEYLTCEYEDYIIRMKEYERQRRLALRQKKDQANDSD